MNGQAQIFSNSLQAVSSETTLINRRQLLAGQFNIRD